MWLRQIPIIFLTARDTENDTVTGFNLGADDYISKPFSIREVMVRVRAVIRRTADKQGKDVEPTVISYQGLVLNIDKKTVSIDGEECLLPKQNLNCSDFSWKRRVECSHARNSSSAYGLDVLVLDPNGGCQHHPYEKENRKVCEVHSSPDTASDIV